MEKMGELRIREEELNEVREMEKMGELKIREEAELNLKEEQTIEQTIQEEKTAPFPKPLDFNMHIQQIIKTVGTIELTPEEKEILYAPIDEKRVEIRPHDGTIYLPWSEYVDRLHRAFGLNWGLIPQGMPKLGGNDLILWGFFLIIKGKYAGFAIGEQKYIPENSQMTWGDACEGAKSNALMRLCKGIGIGLELWKPEFIKQWKEKHARQKEIIDRRGRKVKVWEKKEKIQPATTNYNHQTTSSPQRKAEKSVSMEKVETKEKQTASEKGLMLDEKGLEEDIELARISTEISQIALQRGIDLNKVCLKCFKKEFSKINLAEAIKLKKALLSKR